MFSEKIAAVAKDNKKKKGIIKYLFPKIKFLRRAAASFMLKLKINLNKTKNSRNKVKILNKTILFNSKASLVLKNTAKQSGIKKTIAK